jgi:hypothetical protein
MRELAIVGDTDRDSCSQQIKGYGLRMYVVGRAGDSVGR